MHATRARPTRTTSPRRQSGAREAETAANRAEATEAEVKAAEAARAAATAAWARADEDARRKSEAQPHNVAKEAERRAREAETAANRAEATEAEVKAAEAARVAATAAWARADESSLRHSGGEAEVRLDKLKKLRAVASPTEAQRERIAQLEAGKAKDTQEVANARLKLSHPSNPLATFKEQAQFNCMPGCRIGGGVICVAIGYRPNQLDPVSKAPKTGAVPARVKIPASHKECFGGTTPSRDIFDETIDFSVGRAVNGVVGWPGPVPITRVRPNVAPKEAAPKPVPSAGVKKAKTAHDTVADAADEVADGAADKASGEKGVVLGGDESMPLAHAHDGNTGAKAAATAAPVPTPTQGVATLKQVKLVGFLVPPKPSSEPTAPSTAAMGGAE